MNLATTLGDRMVCLNLHDVSLLVELFILNDKDEVIDVKMGVSLHVYQDGLLYPSPLLLVLGTSDGSGSTSAEDKIQSTRYLRSRC